MSKLWLPVENLKYIKIKVLTYVGAFLLLKRERNMSDARIIIDTEVDNKGLGCNNSIINLLSYQIIRNKIKCHIQKVYFTK